MPYVIGKLKAAGYQLVTVAECTGHPAYQWVGSPTPRDVSYDGFPSAEVPLKRSIGFVALLIRNSDDLDDLVAYRTRKRKPLTNFLFSFFSDDPHDFLHEWTLYSWPFWIS